jgi:hypothetical protein
MFGNYLASCSYDKKVIIWKETNNNKWSPFYEYCGHESSGILLFFVQIFINNILKKFNQNFKLIQSLGHHLNLV